MEKIMISGGAGFVGASLALYFKQKYPGYEITVLDNLKRRGSELNIPRLKNAAIQFIHCDVRSKEDFDGLPACTTFIEASAEPSVMAGINSPVDYLIHT